MKAASQTRAAPHDIEAKGHLLEKVYTIGEASAELGIPASTIRYYDKNGLFPNMRRSQGGIRVFAEDDLEWVR